MKRFPGKFVESWWLAPIWFAGTLVVAVPLCCIALGFLGWVAEKVGGPAGNKGDGLRIGPGDMVVLDLFPKSVKIPPF